MKKNKKHLEKKIKDKQYDQLVKRETLRSNFIERARGKSAAMADCKCKRINNVEEGLTKSVMLQ